MVQPKKTGRKKLVPGNIFRPDDWKSLGGSEMHEISKRGKQKALTPSGTHQIGGEKEGGQNRSVKRGAPMTKRSQKIKSAGSR